MLLKRVFSFIDLVIKETFGLRDGGENLLPSSIWLEGKGGGGEILIGFEIFYLSFFFFSFFLPRIRWKSRRKTEDPISINRDVLLVWSSFIFFFFPLMDRGLFLIDQYLSFDRLKLKFSLLTNRNFNFFDQSILFSIDWKIIFHPSPFLSYPKLDCPCFFLNLFSPTHCTFTFWFIWNKYCYY